MSRRAETDLEREGLAVGCLLAATDLERARRVAAVLPPPAAFLDPTARAAMTLALDLLSRGELPSAAVVFTEGTVGSRSLFSAEDRERLRSWQIDAELTDGELVTIGRLLSRGARTRTLGQKLKTLGLLVERGVDRDGRPFGPEQARAFFEQIARDYNAAHAGGIKGSEAVQLTRARYEQQRKEGRSGFTRTGIPLLDKVFGGTPHKLVYLLGPGGGGKSVVLGTMIDLQQALGQRGVLSSLEDNHEWPVTRHMALMLGLKQREVYSSPFPDEAKAQAAEEYLFERWKNLTILTKQNGRTVDEHLQLWAQYIVQEGASVFYFDNLTAADHQVNGRNDSVHAAAARSIERLAAFADTWHVTVIVAAHTKNDWFVRTRGKEPPMLNDAADTGGGIAADRFARLGLSVWSSRKDELRLTCIKNTAEGRLVGTTLAFDVHSDQGLLDPDTGREINLEEERRQRTEERKRESKTARDARFREAKDRAAEFAEEQKAKKAAAEAEIAAKKPTQGTLIDVAQPKERA